MRCRHFVYWYILLLPLCLIMLLHTLWHIYACCASFALHRTTHLGTDTALAPRIEDSWWWQCDFVSFLFCSFVEWSVRLTRYFIWISSLFLNPYIFHLNLSAPFTAGVPVYLKDSSLWIHVFYLMVDLNSFEFFMLCHLIFFLSFLLMLGISNSLLSRRPWEEEK